MSHYECPRCGDYMCTPSRCRARDELEASRCRARDELEAKELKEKLARLQLTESDVALLERAVYVIELALPETTYAKGMILAELLEDIKKRLK